MLLNLSHINTAHEQYHKAYLPEAFGADQEGFRLLAPVSLAFDIFKDKAQFHLIGRTQTTIELPCGRCLEPYPLPVDAAFDLRYQPHTANTGEDEREIEEDDLSTAFYENDAIDLGQLMVEQFLLAMPMKPLCRSDCKGLCAICGTNLNRDTCGCTRDWEDPRFAVLKTLTKNADS